MHSKVSFFKKPVLIGWLLVAAIGAQAATYYVSTKGNDANDGTSLALAKQTIQAGINVAANGDTVLVAHGRYGRIYIPPGITVRSVNGPGSTKIDGGGVRRCAYLDTGAVLDGFTVWNGFSSYGGGVDVWGGTVRNCMITRNIGYLYGGAFLMYGTMENCTISGNSAGSVGGGVYAYSSTVRNCTIIGNIATYWGAGAYLLHSTVENCTISGNSAGSVGGGVYVRGGTLRNCTIDKNIANVDGGGTYLLYSTVENSTIIENIAYRDGGGVYADSSTVRNCTISENIAYLNGGGSYLRFGTVENCMISGNTSYGSAPTINYDCGGGVFVLAGTVRNCAITGNIAYWDGGGAFLMGGTMENCTINGNYAMSFGGGVRIIFGTVKNCLISGNTADDIGGGVHAERGRMENCTISGNTVTSSGGTGVGGGVYVNGGTVRNCIAYYNQDTDAIGLISYSCIGVGMNITGVGNIINEPQFVSTGTGYGTNHVSGDYHLRPTSPCINIGTNQSWMTNAVDLDGLPRIFNGVVDMGAYECVGSAIMRNPMILSNRCDYGSNATWQTFEVWNAGTGAMAYALSPNVDWLSLSPASGMSEGEVDPVSVNYASAGLPPGNYTGIVTITSAQAINSPQVVTVYLWVDKLDQMITFPPIASQPVTGRVGLAVTASSGLPVSFTVASGPGVISGETNLSFLAAGTVWVVASQAGNSIWEAATPVTNAVIVTSPPVGEIRFAETNVVVNEDVVNVELKVVRTNGNYGVVSVDYTNRGVTASAGLDYRVVAGRLTWADGDASDKVITIPIVDDSADEPDEVFEVVLTNAVGTSISGTNVASVTIVDNDDPPAGEIQFAVTSTKVGEAGGSVTLSVVRTGGSFGSASVDYATANGTALAGADYTSKSGTLSWSDGDTASKTITVSITDDSIEENDEALTVTLRNAVGAGLGSPSVATVTIVDNDGPLVGEIRFAETNVVVNEDVVNVELRVVRTNGNYGVVSVDYTNRPVTASAGVDYGVVTGRLTWADGDASDKIITIPIVDDSADEPDEVFEVVLANAVGTSISGTSVASVTIVDNDDPPAGVIQFAVTSTEVGEAGGSVTLSVVRIGGSFGSASVDYATANGTALAGSDYTSRSGALSWSDGDTVSKTITVSITDDSINENAETFTVTLSNAVGAGLGTPSSATVTIVDNDDPPEYQADIEVSEFKWVPKVMQKLEHPSMISFVLRNDGPSDMKPPDTQVEARFYLSGNMIFGDGDDILVGTKQGDVTLAAGDQMTVRYSGQAHNTDVTIPEGISGDYYVFMSVVHVLPSGLVDPDGAYAMREGPITIGKPSDEERNRAVVNDYDGDGQSDMIVYDEASGEWAIQLSVSGEWVRFVFGGPGYETVSGDYDGDCKVDPAVHHKKGSQWDIMLSGIEYQTISFDFGGEFETKGAVGDYNGDTMADPGLYEEGSGRWYVLLPNTEHGNYEVASAVFGGLGYTPVSGDYDGDGCVDQAVYGEETGNWQVMLSGQGYGVASVAFGGPGYKPVVGDYDGDGRADLMLYHEATGVWVGLMSASGYAMERCQYGGPGSIPVAGDFDGDGKSDIGVYNTEQLRWSIRLSGTGYNWVSIIYH